MARGSIGQTGPAAAVGGVLDGAVLDEGLGLAGEAVALGVVVPGCDDVIPVDGVAVGDAPGCGVPPHAASAASTIGIKTTERRERIALTPCDMVSPSWSRHEPGLVRG